MTDQRHTLNDRHDSQQPTPLFARLRSLSQGLSAPTPISVRAPQSMTAFFFGSGWRILGTVIVVVTLLASGVLERVATATGQAIFRLLEQLLYRVVMPLLLVALVLAVTVAIVAWAIRTLLNPK